MRLAVIIDCKMKSMFCSYLWTCFTTDSNLETVSMPWLMNSPIPTTKCILTVCLISILHRKNRFNRPICAQIRPHRHFKLCNHHTQRNPVDSFASNIKVVSDSIDVFSQYNGLHVVQAVQSIVVTADKIVQIINVPEHQDEKSSCQWLLQSVDFGVWYDLFPKLFVIVNTWPIYVPVKQHFERQVAQSSPVTQGS